MAELLDNSLDEVRNGATFVNVDVIENKKDGCRMLLVEDDGGGMDPNRMRQCMSLGYSAKSKMPNAIGQYGNGFKTSTMRLGADVVVFSRFRSEDGKRSTMSIGLLSYTYLRSTRKEDIEVPMLDYEKQGNNWSKIVRTSIEDWNGKVDTIVKWSPFSSEAELLEQFNEKKGHGTRILIYNLWEDDQGLQELDFDTDPRDIQIRGANRDEKNIEMAKLYPNSRHFLTYRHSLRSYASILYLKLPTNFRMILRGKEVEHHNIVNDLMMTQEVTYRPQSTNELPRDSKNMVAVVTVGFVKDAKSHIDVQGFNVYHKNRLIKPFWRVWHPPGSDGRGVIGVLEANFIEPAHDKQSFERTIVLTRLESKLIQMQRTYWTTHCHEIGYAQRASKNQTKETGQTFQGSNSSALVSENRLFLPSIPFQKSVNGHTRGQIVGSLKHESCDDESNVDNNETNVHPEKSLTSKRLHGTDSSKHNKLVPSLPCMRPTAEEKTGSPGEKSFGVTTNTTRPLIAEKSGTEDGKTGEISMTVDSKIRDYGVGSSDSLEQLREENRVLKERLAKKENKILGDLLKDLDEEKKKCKSLEAQLQEARQRIQELTQGQDTMIDMFAEETKRREIDEENLVKKLEDASNTIQELRKKLLDKYT